MPHFEHGALFVGRGRYRGQESGSKEDRHSMEGERREGKMWDFQGIRIQKKIGKNLPTNLYNILQWKKKQEV